MTLWKGNSKEVEGLWIFSGTTQWKNQVKVYLISRLPINGHKYVTVFLDLQILDDFVVKYLPLPRRYDTNFNVPLSIDHLSLRNSKNIFGHCRIFASDAT